MNGFLFIFADKIIFHDQSCGQFFFINMCSLYVPSECLRKSYCKPLNLTNKQFWVEKKIELLLHYTIYYFTSISRSSLFSTDIVKLIHDCIEYNQY